MYETIWTVTSLWFGLWLWDSNVFITQDLNEENVPTSSATLQWKQGCFSDKMLELTLPINNTVMMYWPATTPNQSQAHRSQCIHRRSGTSKSLKWTSPCATKWWGNIVQYTFPFVLYNKRRVNLEIWRIGIICVFWRLIDWLSDWTLLQLKGWGGTHTSQERLKGNHKQFVLTSAIFPLNQGPHLCKPGKQGTPWICVTLH